MDNSYYRFLGIKFSLYHEPLRQKALLHSIFWLLFLASHLTYFIPAFHKELLSAPLRFSYALYYLRLVPIFYCYKAVFAFLKTRVHPIALYVLSLLAVFLLIHLITILTYAFLDYRYGLSNLSPAFQAIGSLYLKPIDLRVGTDWLVFVHDFEDLQLLLLPLGLQLAKFGMKENALKQKIENSNLHRELKDLRAKLAPHLGYNLINAAYYEIQPVSEKSAFYLKKLADMLRYSVYQTESESIPLQEELDCVKSYIELEQLRRGLCPKISFAQQGSITPTQKIPTMLLLTLTENAFKHSVGSLPEDNWIDISLKVSAKGIYFRIANSKPPASVAARQTKFSGIGLINIQKMLELNFPGRHSFKVKDSERRFDLEISLPFLDRL